MTKIALMYEKASGKYLSDTKGSIKMKIIIYFKKVCPFICKKNVVPFLKMH